MNGQPHTHLVTVTRTYPALDAGMTVVKYGDTKKTILWPWVPFYEARLRRAARRAIRKHDRGSVSAEHRAELMHRLQNELTPRPGDYWASEKR